MAVPWKRLVRYTSHEGRVRFGDPQIQDSKADIVKLAEDGELFVEVLEGTHPLKLQRTGTSDRVARLLSPLAVEDVPFIRCIGLNYKTHILETGRPLPACPTVFSKPGTAVTGPIEDIPIPTIAQAQADYEGELAVLIGKPAKNVRAENALDYVSAYAASNDVSSRDWQREPDKAGPIPQWTFSKSFDSYAPLGPCLVSTAILGSADRLSLRTTVNGEIRQSGNTSDLCFDVKQLVAFCSQGQTLQAGSIILTGTPGGVGLFMKPPTFLKHDDVVEVEIEGIGRIRNRIRFE